MNIFPNIDLNNIAPIAAAIALAVLICVTLILRAVFRSRIVVPVAIVIGIVIAGPALGVVLAAIVNSLVIGAILCAGATIAVLLILRSHSDLREIAHETLSLLPRRSMVAPLPPAGENPHNAIIDQPTTVRRVTRHNDAGQDWGF